MLSRTPAWAVLLGDPSARTPAERNLVRAVFAGGPTGLAARPVLQEGDALNPGDIRLIVYTVAAGSADAEKPEFLRVTNGVRTDGPSPSGPGPFSRP